MVRLLPIFRGYTVDARLGEFRKVVKGKGFETISFNSLKGKKLLRLMQKEQPGLINVVFEVVKR